MRINERHGFSALVCVLTILTAVAFGVSALGQRGQERVPTKLLLTRGEAGAITEYWVVPDDGSHAYFGSGTWHTAERVGESDYARLTGGTITLRSIPKAMTDAEIRAKYNIPESAKKRSEFPGL